ncbi:MAG TPA: hypothetical protein VFH48_42815 [Chloroflexota bacterium]|nr:hypothetical protein [Chloroflexota bacterium]
MSDDIIPTVLSGIDRRIVLRAHAALPTTPVPLVAAAVAVGLPIAGARRGTGRRLRCQGRGRTAPPL